MRTDWTSRRSSYLDRSLTPSRELEGYIERAATTAGRLEPFQAFFAEDARDAAAAADDRYRSGDPRPLEGMFIAVKDLIAVENQPRWGGTPALEPVVQERDAAIVAALRSRGAIPIATARTYELGLSMDNGELGIARNPRDPERMPGGSSSGSAVAVAARLVDAAIGTDTAGSIRLPAAWCGVVGYKPPHGVLPMDGILPLARFLDTVGFLTGSVRDAEWIRRSLDDAAPPARGSAVTVGLDETSLAGVTGAVRSEVLRAAERMASAVTVRPIALPDPDEILAPFWRIVQHEATLSNADRLDRLIGREGPLADQLRAGAALPPEAVAQDRERLRSYAALARQALEGLDAVLMPGPPGPAPRFDDGLVDTAVGPRPWYEVVLAAMVPASLLGLPAIAVPSAENGLPVGIQIMGSGRDEHALWRIGLLLDRAG